VLNLCSKSNRWLLIRDDLISKFLVQDVHPGIGSLSFLLESLEFVCTRFIQLLIAFSRITVIHLFLLNDLRRINDDLFSGFLVRQRLAFIFVEPTAFDRFQDGLLARLNLI
jgi:hypothetical protein